jgi:hypothetical protein
MNLRPSSTYAAFNLSGDNPQNWEITQFSTSDQANGASPPSADARVRIVDLRFRGAKRAGRGDDAAGSAHRVPRSGPRSVLDFVGGG